MNKSNSIAELAKALTLAQAEMKPVAMNSVNPFLKNKFADLGAMIEASRPVLAKHSLSLSQFPTAGERGDIGITTILMHASGEWLENTITLPVEIEKGKSQAQVAGSLITYLRRYSWAAVLGLYAEEDTDAQTGRQESVKKAAAASVKTGNGTEPGTVKDWVEFCRDNKITASQIHQALGVPKVSEWIAAEVGRTMEQAKALCMGAKEPF